MSKTFFISDLHFGHANAIKFDQRPFKDIDEMDAELIRRWNAKVKPEDTVYILGDMIWKNRNNTAKQIIESLNGKKILIRGNHDSTIINRPELCSLFANVLDYADTVVKLEDGSTKRCILSHYFIPMYNAHRYGAIHLHGHSHNSEESWYEEEIVSYLREKGLDIQIYNVGCMYWNYEPVTLDEILVKQEEEKI